MVSSPAAARPRVTLFVTGWNQADIIGPAIESAFAQTWEPLEIILSDDASRDGTGDLMEAAATWRGPHAVRVLRAERNGGIVGNVNRVMAAAQGELIVMAGGDDISAPHRVARLVEAWEGADRRAHLLHSAAAVIDAAGRPTGHRREANPRLLAARGPRQVLDAPRTVLGATMAWSRTLWDVFGPLPAEALVEDLLLTFRAALLGPILYVDEDLVSWREGGVSWTPPRITARERLHGAPFRLVRWRAAACRALLADLDRVDRPDREEVRALAAAQAEALGLQVALADAGTAGRLALLPRALHQARREGAARPLKLALQYLLEVPYTLWRGTRHGS